MAVRSPQRVQISGTTPTSHAASGGGDKITNPGEDVLIRVSNGGVGSINCTVTTPGTVGGLAIADQVVPVGAGAVKYIGPLTREMFGNTDGQVDLAWSGVTTVVFEVIEV